MSPDRIDLDLADADIVLLGVGIETLSVLPHLRRSGVARVRVVEAATLTPERAAALTEHGVDPSAVLAEVPAEAEVVLRSPGFPRRRADVDTLYATARLATTPTGLWLATRGPVGTVAVTGTKGKSSTATLIAAGLEHCGVPAFLAGNIGTAAWSHDPHRAGVAVVELSSYQGADLLTTGEVAVLTLLADDHLDWHGSAAAYRHDKLRILDPGPDAANGPDGRTDTDLGDVALCDAGDDTPGDDEGRVILALDGQALPGHLDTWVARVEAAGDYRDRNLALAVAAIRAVIGRRGGEPPTVDELTDVLQTHYPELASRFEVVPSDDGIVWIDDALGSNPSATAAALERVAPGPAVLIGGGHDRGVPLDPVIRALATWPTGTLTIVWLGDAADHRFTELAAQPAVVQAVTAESMDAAVRAAATTGTTGTTVLFSPLAPTERAEGNWADRSRAFRNAIDHIP